MSLRGQWRQRSSVSPERIPSPSRMRAIGSARRHAPACCCPPLSKTAGAEPARESHHEQLPWHIRRVGPWRPSWHQDNTHLNIWCMGSLHSERILRPHKGGGADSHRQ